MRTLIFILLMLALYLSLWTFLGIKWTMLFMALTFFLMPTIFLIKKEYYFKYSTFVNPKYNQLCNEKGEEFKNKNRITNIISWYILSAIFLLQGIFMENTKFLFSEQNTSNLVFFICIIVVFSVIAWISSMYIFKKSKTNSEFIGYSIALGIIMAIILLGVIGTYVFSKILCF